MSINYKLVINLLKIHGSKRWCVEGAMFTHHI